MALSPRNSRRQAEFFDLAWGWKSSNGFGRRSIRFGSKRLGRLPTTCCQTLVSKVSYQASVETACKSGRSSSSVVNAALKLTDQGFPPKRTHPTACAARNHARVVVSLP